MARARLLGACLLMACSAGSGPDATRATAELSVQPIAILGPGAHTDASGMDSVILGHVTAMVEVAKGSVMVLDREYKRVAIYSEGGRVLPVVMTMQGNGPGELVEPIGLGVLSNGDISILDYAQHRVSIYDRAGQYLRSFQINVAEPKTFIGLLIGLVGVAAIVGGDFDAADPIALLQIAVVVIGYAAGPAILARRP